jgi:hypothetical protein
MDRIKRKTMSLSFHRKNSANNSETYHPDSKIRGRLMRGCSVVSSSAFCSSLQDAEFEQSKIRERTRAGLVAAPERGTRVGRPAKLSCHQQQDVIRTVRDGSKTAADAARLFGLRPSAPVLITLGEYSNPS